MRYLGLDLGNTTLGISMTDKTGTIVSPYKVIKFPSKKYASVIPELKEIIEKYDVEKIILGYPKNMNGSIGEAAKRSEYFQELLKKEGIDSLLVDERLSTKVAEWVIHENNLNIKKGKRKIDAVAASVILERYLRSAK